MFWSGVCLLAVAALLLGWNAIKDSRIADSADLQTVEGTLIEYRAGRRMPQRGFRPAKRFRLRARPADVLRIQKADGATAEFSSRERIAPPKSGWRKGEPVRVKHDSRGNIYELVVGDETLRDLASTVERREADSAGTNRIARVLLFVGAPLTAVGYFASRQRKPVRLTLPRT
jgi:hypothetical protein